MAKPDTSFTAPYLLPRIVLDKVLSHGKCSLGLRLPRTEQRSILVALKCLALGPFRGSYIARFCLVRNPAELDSVTEIEG